MKLHSKQEPAELVSTNPCEHFEQHLWVHASQQASPSFCRQQSWWGQAGGAGSAQHHIYVSSSRRPHRHCVVHFDYFLDQFVAPKPQANLSGKQKHKSETIRRTHHDKPSEWHITHLALALPWKSGLLLSRQEVHLPDPHHNSPKMLSKGDKPCQVVGKKISLLGIIINFTKVMPKNI